MGSLSSMRCCADDIATNIALVYVSEADRLGIKIKEILDGDIEIASRIDVQAGVIVYSLKGALGNKINNPDVKIGIFTDLLRGLRRGESAYNRHSKNIPKGEDIKGLVEKCIVTLLLLEIGNRYTGKRVESRNPKVIKKILEVEQELAQRV